MQDPEADSRSEIQPRPGTMTLGRVAYSNPSSNPDSDSRRRTADPGSDPCTWNHDAGPHGGLQTPALTRTRNRDAGPRGGLQTTALTPNSESRGWTAWQTPSAEPDPDRSTQDRMVDSRPWLRSPDSDPRRGLCNRARTPDPGQRSWRRRAERRPPLAGHRAHLGAPAISRPVPPGQTAPAALGGRRSASCGTGAAESRARPRGGPCCEPSPAAESRARPRGEPHGEESPTNRTAPPRAARRLSSRTAVCSERLLRHPDPR